MSLQVQVLAVGLLPRNRIRYVHLACSVPSSVRSPNHTNSDLNEADLAHQPRAHRIPRELALAFLGVVEATVRLDSQVPVVTTTLQTSSLNSRYSVQVLARTRSQRSLRVQSLAYSGITNHNHYLPYSRAVLDPKTSQQVPLENTVLTWLFLRHTIHQFCRYCLAR